MSAYLILLTLFAIAWAIIGFSVAMLLLKLRWNLVVGVLIPAVVFGLPTIVWNYALIESEPEWTHYLWNVTTIYGMIQLTYEVMILVSCGGFILGILAGTVCGLWPKKDDQGSRVRGAKQWSTGKLAAAGPIALAITATLFFLADIRAQQRLAQLRARHQSILDVQEDVAPRLQNDAAQVHDALMLSLLEDSSPDWVLANAREAESRVHPVPTTIDRREYDLLKIFLPNFPQTPQVLDYVARHEDDYLKLRQSVLADGLEYRHWNEQVARFAAVHALAALHQNNQDSAIQDLRLLGAMGSQSLDKRIEQSFSFVQIEEFRYLVFQAFLGEVSPVPAEVYQEMLSGIGDTTPSLRRGLKRHLSQDVVLSIDALLDDSPTPRSGFRDTFERMAKRIIFQEHIPPCVARMETQINQAFIGTTDPYVRNPQVAFPAMWDRNEAWLMTSGFSNDAYFAFQVRYHQNVRQELVKAVRMLESQRAEKGRFLTQPEFLAGITTPEFTTPISMDYLTLHNPTTGKAEGAIVASFDHTQLNDYLGFYLGPAIFPILDARWPTLTVRTHQANSSWELAQVKNNPQRLMIPTPKASTKNRSAPMR